MVGVVREQCLVIDFRLVGGVSNLTWVWLIGRGSLAMGGHGSVAVGGRGW